MIFIIAATLTSRTNAIEITRVAENAESDGSTSDERATDASKPVIVVMSKIAQKDRHISVDVNKDEVQVQMPERTTNRKLPFRKQDLRKQRNRKLSLRKQTIATKDRITKKFNILQTEKPTLAQETTEKNEDSVDEIEYKIHKESTIKPKILPELVKGTQVVTSSAKKQVKARKRIHQRLKVRRRKKKKSRTRQKVSPAPANIKIKENDVSASNIILSTNAERYPEHDQLETIQVSKPSKGGPRAPSPLRKRRIKQRLKTMQPVQDIPLDAKIPNKRSSLLISGNAPQLKIVEKPNIHYEPSYDAESQSKVNSVANVYSSDAFTDETFEIKKIKVEPTLKAKDNENDGKSINSKLSKSMAVSFQHRYKPTRNPNTSRKTRKTLTSGLGTPRSYPQNPNIPAPGYGVPSNDPFPKIPVNTYGPPNPPRFPGNINPPIIPGNINPPRIPGNFVPPGIPPIRPANPRPVSTGPPRGVFGTPPLGTPPPAFVVPAHMSQNFRRSNIDDIISTHNTKPRIPSNTPMPTLVPQIPILATRSVRSGRNNLIPQKTSTFFTGTRRPLISPILSSVKKSDALHNFRSNFVNNPVSPSSGNFHDTSFVKPPLSLQNSHSSRNSIASTPISMTQHTQHFPGLESPVNSQNFHVQSPSLRGGVPRPFNPLNNIGPQVNTFTSPTLNSNTLPASSFNMPPAVNLDTPPSPKFTGMIRPFIRHQTPIIPTINQFPNAPTSFIENTLPVSVPNSIRNTSPLQENIIRPQTISENLHQFRDAFLDDKSPLNAKDSALSKDTQSIVPPSPSFHFEPPPALTISSVTAKPAFPNDKRVFAEHILPLTSPPVPALPKDNIEIITNEENTLPIINTFHHLRLQQLEPPFRSISPELTANMFKFNINQGTSSVIPLLTTQSPVTKGNIFANIKNFNEATSFRSLTTNTITANTPSNTGTTAQPFSTHNNIKNSQTPPVPPTNSNRFTATFDFHDEKESGSKSAIPPSIIESFTLSPTFSKSVPSIKQTPAVQSVTSSLVGQKPFKVSSHLAPMPTGNHPRHFTPTDQHPVFKIMKQNGDIESLSLASPLLSKPILPKGAQNKGTFRKSFRDSFRDTVNDIGLSKLTKAQHIFRPITPPQLLKNVKSQKVQSGIKIDMNNLNKNKDHRTRNNKNSLRMENINGNIRSLLSPASNLNLLSSSLNQVNTPHQLLSSPAPPRPFFNKPIRAQKTIQPSLNSNNGNVFGGQAAGSDQNANSGNILSSIKQILEENKKRRDNIFSSQSKKPSSNTGFQNSRQTLRSNNGVTLKSFNEFSNSATLDGLKKDDTRPILNSLRGPTLAQNKLRSTSMLKNNVRANKNVIIKEVEAPAQNARNQVGAHLQSFLDAGNFNPQEQRTPVSLGQAPRPFNNAFTNNNIGTSSNAVTNSNAFTNSNALTGSNAFVSSNTFTSSNAFTNNNAFANNNLVTNNNAAANNIAFTNNNALLRNEQPAVILADDATDSEDQRVATRLDLMDFSQFEGRSFIFMRTNDHEYTVVFPLSESQRRKLSTGQQLNEILELPVEDPGRGLS